MIDLGDRTRAWAQEDDRKDPFITLYEIDLDGSTTLRLVKGDPLGIGKVTYNGEDYLAAKIVDQEIEETLSRDLPEYELRISNVDGVAGGIMEAYELDGRKITVRLFPSPGGVGSGGVLAPLDEDVLVRSWRIGHQKYTATEAIVTVGPPKALRGQARRRFVRRCAHTYQQRFQVGNLCGYPGDEFEADTAQDFLAGATSDDELVCRFGWRTLNALEVKTQEGIWDVDRTEPGALACETRGTNADWDTERRGAPFAYKLLEGDFDVQAQTAISNYRDGTVAGILCQSVTDPTSWILIGRAAGDVGDWLVQVVATLAGVRQDVIYGLDAEYLRLTRVADALTARSSGDGATWTTVAELDPLALGDEIRLGLFLSGSDAASGTIAASWPWIRFLAGGLDACARTIDDCRAHGNAHRFGGYPGMPAL